MDNQSTAPQKTVFNDGQHHISGGNFMSAGNIHLNQQIITNKGLETTAFSKLTNNVAPSALHNSGEISDPPKCHPGTRVDVLSVLITWALLTVYEYPIRWLNGPAGAGKSAIMRSFAEMLVEKGLLLATFFFFRSDGRRNTVERLIPTIAYQLCITVPPLQPLVEHTIELNPLIFNSGLANQIQGLIIDPFLRYFYNPNSTIITPFPRIIIIDGLDECAGDGKQQEILRTLCKMVQTLPIPIAIVFASRPEYQIRITFELGSLKEVSSRITLDESFNPDEDIRRFYLTEFATIQSTHRMRSYLGADTWPSVEVIQILVNNASGQFIYASTIMKFVQSNRHNPATRLQIILGQADRGRSKPFQQLDALYTVVFRNVDPEILPDTLRVLGIILTPAEPLHQTPKFLEALLGFPAGHVRFLLLDLESLLTVLEDEEDIHIYHTSLSDFLFDKSRAGEFFIDRGLVCSDIASLCINLSSRDMVTIDAFSRSLFGSYVKRQLMCSFRNATPTTGLHQMVISCDMDQMISFQVQHSEEAGPTIGVLALLFLIGLKGSHFLDADNLYQMKLPPYERFLSPHLIRDWLRPGDHFGRTLLWVLLSAAPVGLDGRTSFCKYLSMPGTDVNILPDVSQSGPSPVSYDLDDWLADLDRSEDWYPMISLIVDIINSPTGLLRHPKGQEACTDLTVHMVKQIKENVSEENLSVDHLDHLDKTLPFLLNASLARNDLITAVQQARRDASRNSPWLGSVVIIAAMDAYLRAHVQPADAQLHDSPANAQAHVPLADTQVHGSQADIQAHVPPANIQVHVPPADIQRVKKEKSSRSIGKILSGLFQKLSAMKS